MSSETGEVLCEREITLVDITSREYDLAIIQEIVENAIRNNDDLNIKNTKGETYLMMAVKYRLRISVVLLLHNGADSNITDEEGNTPLFAAVSNGDRDMIRLLLDYGVNICRTNRQGFSALYWAVLKSTRETALFVKESGATIRPRDVCDAARNGSVESMKLLKLLGADFNVTDPTYRTSPLHRSVLNTNDEGVLKYLLRSGADVNATNSFGHSPLHTAIARNNMNAVRSLVESGANVNASNYYGDTPLHYAVLQGHEEFVKLLVISGANPNMINVFDQTPLSISVSSNWHKPEVTDALRSAVTDN